MVERGGVVALGGVLGDRRNAPALVERYPRHDARVAAVAADRLGPLLDDALHGGGAERIRAGHLLPDQQAEPVAPREEARVLDLLVDADPVESQRLHRFDLGAERVVVGSGEMRLRPVALLEDEPQVVGPTVEEEPAVADTDAAVPEVRRDLVEHRPVRRDERDPGVEEGGVLRRPEQVALVLAVPRLGEVEDADRRRGADADGGLGDNPVGPGEADLEPGALDRHAAQLGLEGHLAAHQVGRPVEPGQVPVADHLAPDRLPDAGRAVVPDVVRRGSPVLLAARLGRVVDRILGAHDDDLVATLVERVGDVSVERGVPALVAGDQLAVDPDLGPVVDRPEVQQHPPARADRARAGRRGGTRRPGARPGRGSRTAPTPGGRAPGSSRRRVRRRRDQPSRRPTSSSSWAKPQGPAEVLPLRPPQLRSRVGERRRGIGHRSTVRRGRGGCRPDRLGA